MLSRKFLTSENNFAFTKSISLLASCVLFSAVSGLWGEKCPLPPAPWERSEHLWEPSALQRGPEPLPSAREAATGAAGCRQEHGKGIGLDAQQGKAHFKWLCKLSTIVVAMCPPHSVQSAGHFCVLSGAVCNRCCSRSTPRKEWATERHLHTWTAGAAAEVKKVWENRGGDVGPDGRPWG